MDEQHQSTMKPKLILIRLAAMTLAFGADVQPQAVPASEGQSPAIPEQEPGTPEQTSLPVGVTDFADLRSALELYGKLVGRMVLISTAIQTQAIKITVERPLDRQEAVQALDSALILNEIAMINVGDRFVKAVPIPGSCEGAAIRTEAGFITQVAQLTNARPSAVAKTLAAFSSNPGTGILPIDPSQILVMRDRPANIEWMMDVLPKIDAAPEAFISEIIPVKYALAAEVAAALTSMSTNISSVAGSPPRTAETTGTSTGSHGGRSLNSRFQTGLKKVGAVVDIQRLGPTKIIADERSNSLIVFASGQDIEKIKGLVSKFDVVPAQVLIEAVVARVSLDDPASSRPGKASSHRNPGNDPLPPTNSFLETQFVFGAETNAAVSLPGGLGYLARLNDDLEAMVSALATNSRVVLLQRPRIQTSVGVPAQLFISDSFARPSGYAMGASLTCGSSFSGYRTLPTSGATIEVTPSINSDGSVAIDIHQTIEKLSGTVHLANVGEVPVTTRQEAQAKITIHNHGIVLLGGLDPENKDGVSSGVPKRIPVLGTLFRGPPARPTRSELIVLIRLTILPTPEVATRIFSR
jgi:general secretion pathway protein D